MKALIVIWIIFMVIRAIAKKATQAQQQQQGRPQQPLQPRQPVSPAGTRGAAVQRPSYTQQTDAKVTWQAPQEQVDRYLGGIKEERMPGPGGQQGAIPPMFQSPGRTTGQVPPMRQQPVPVAQPQAQPIPQMPMQAGQWRPGGTPLQQFLQMGAAPQEIVRKLVRQQGARAELGRREHDRDTTTQPLSKSAPLEDEIREGQIRILALKLEDAEHLEKEGRHDEAAAKRRQVMADLGFPLEQIQQFGPTASHVDKRPSLRGPADLRRAIVLAEVLGPPKALRRKKRSHNGIV